MSTKPFTHPEFSRVTAIRLEHHPELGLYIKLEKDDVLDAAVVEGEDALQPQTPSSHGADNDIEKGETNVSEPVSAAGSSFPAPRPISATDEVDLKIQVARHGIVLFAAAGWLHGCDKIPSIKMGSYFPIDETDESGMTPVNRRLWWSPAAAEIPGPSRDLTVTVKGNGNISCRDGNITLMLAFPAYPDGSNFLHIVLLTRAGEGGSITIPSIAGLPSLELKL